jgi:hypothetical protein
MRMGHKLRSSLSMNKDSDHLNESLHYLRLQGSGAPDQKPQAEANQKVDYKPSINLEYMMLKRNG